MLVRTGRPEDQDLDALSARASELERVLRQRVEDLEQVRTALAAFKVEYRQRVGLLHDELDELEEQIAAADLEGWSQRAEQSGARTGDPAGRPDGAPAVGGQPKYTSDGVRRLFRDVAKAIHPDLAGDEAARDRRHRLMIEANRAYAQGDEVRLRWILDTWARRPEAVEGSDEASTRARLLRRVEQLEDELATYAADLDGLRDSPMWKLKTMVDEAAAQGKDLVREMVQRLRTDIMVARNRLAAIQSTP